MHPDTDVLVVGAGPTGLTAAIELARRGIAVHIVDKDMARPYAESRAEDCTRSRWRFSNAKACWRQCWRTGGC